MTKTLKQVLLSAMLALVVAPVFAASSTIDFSFKKPEDVNRNLAENEALFGFSNSSATLNSSGPTAATPNQQNLFGTEGKQWVVGQGVLENVMISTGATSTYVVCFDTSGTTNTALNDPTWNVLYPPLFANTTNAALAFGQTGFGTAPPLAFNKGLYCFPNVGIRYTPVWRAKGD